MHITKLTRPSACYPDTFRCMLTTQKKVNHRVPHKYALSGDIHIMRLGLQVPNFTWPNGQANLGDTFGLIAERAERAGFYSFWVMDHFFQIPLVGVSENEMLESYTALAFAAGRTNRIKLGAMVTGVSYRHPGILVKT